MEKLQAIQTEIKEVSEKNKIFSIIESLLFVTGEPMKLKDISEIIGCKNNLTKSLLKEMSYLYNDENRGIKLISMNDEYQLVTKSENSEYIERILGNNSRQALSQASLETLAIVAYKQPITRIEIDDIRGVKSDSAVAKLIEKSLIKEVGRLEAPGRPILYSTTDEFLKQFGIENTKELPELQEIVYKYINEKEVENNDDNTKENDS
ncbi:SMC-Scp complex subunit ScpB [Clostridium oryzae]|uniref:Segregation and condensation protein B n=1 Tax=Clostridium oryzae TaxID=1450648 RepID=A0A1V4ITR9_9CLOT|nr:SMC-Scp complex subunit ScpB [Clostridium oryzae]OPJ63185.1 segregation and condensation protein B [Clostridium oryzae]